MKIVTPPPQQPVHRSNHPRKLVSSDDEDAVASHHQQQGSEDEEENDSEAEEMAENQDMDSQRLGKRKRSPSARGLTPPKSVKYLLFSLPCFVFDKNHRNLSALLKYYRLASRNVPQFIHLWANVQGIVLHGFMVKGILESLAEDKEDSAEDDGSDSETKEIETPEWVSDAYIDIICWRLPRNFRFKHAYEYITTFLFPSFEKHVGQLEDLDSDKPLKAVFEILTAVFTSFSPKKPHWPLIDQCRFSQWTLGWYNQDQR